MRKFRPTIVQDTADRKYTLDATVMTVRNKGAAKPGQEVYGVTRRELYDFFSKLVNRDANGHIDSEAPVGFYVDYKGYARRSRWDVHWYNYLISPYFDIGCRRFRGDEAKLIREWALDF